MHNGSLIEAHRGGPANQPAQEGPLPSSISDRPFSGSQRSLAQLPLASEPTSTPHQLAAGKYRARWGSKRKKAKQSPPAVGQQALTPLETGADVPIAARPVDPAADSGNNGKPSFGMPKLGTAQVAAQVPKQSESASALLPESAPPAISSPTGLLPTDRDITLPTPRQLPQASQEATDSQPGGSSDQQRSAEFARYELFSSPSGRCCLQPTSLTPWLQMQLNLDGHDTPKTSHSAQWHEDAFAPLAPRPVMRAASDMQPVQSDNPRPLDSLHGCSVSNELQTAGHLAAASGQPFPYHGEAGWHALQGQDSFMGQNAV